MKSKLFLASALLFAACAASASANYYLIGEFNEWDGNNMVPFEENNGVYTLTRTIQGNFKIKDDEGNWYGTYHNNNENNVLWTNHPTVSLTKNGDEVNVYLRRSLEYTFTLDQNMNLTVSGFKYYIVGDFNKWTPAELTYSNGYFSINCTIISGQKFKFVDWSVMDNNIHYFGGDTNENEYVIHSEWCSNMNMASPGKDFKINNNGTFTFEITPDQKLNVHGFNTALNLSIDGTDNTTTLGNFSNNQVVDVTFNGLTLYKDAHWNTICLPFSLDANRLSASPLAGAEIWELTSSSFADGTLNMTFTQKNDGIVAGVPYLVKWANGNNISNPEFLGVTIGASQASQSGNNGVSFIGTFDKLRCGDLGADLDHIYFLGEDDGLYYPENENVGINAFRAYFKLSGAAKVKAINLNFGDDTNSIQTISNETSSNEDYYTIDGRHINGTPATAGIYIHNGRKIIIK